VVNDDRPFRPPAQGPDQILPVVAVNSRGIVGVSWYDRRDQPDNLGWSVRFTMSEDGGETFSPSVRVSESSYDPNRGDRLVLNGYVVGGAERTEFSKGTAITIRLGPGGFFLNGGHTAGMAADADGDFHPFWIDNRTGVPQIWTAAVAVDATARDDGGEMGDGLSDVSGRVTVVLGSPRLEKRTSTISMEVAVKNTSKEAVAGPIKVRLLSLRSALGAPEVVTTDNGERGPGAVWDFTSLLDGGRLEAGKQSKAKKVTFRFAGKWSPPRRWQDMGWLDIDARAFGKAQASSPKN
jgi:hypothetical protein